MSSPSLPRVAATSSVSTQHLSAFHTYSTLSRISRMFRVSLAPLDKLALMSLNSLFSFRRNKSVHDDILRLNTSLTTRGYGGKRGTMWSTPPQGRHHAACAFQNDRWSRGGVRFALNGRSSRNFTFGRDFAKNSRKILVRDRGSVGCTARFRIRCERLREFGQFRVKMMSSSPLDFETARVSDCFCMRIIILNSSPTFACILTVRKQYIIYIIEYIIERYFRYENITEHISIC